MKSAYLDFDLSAVCRATADEAREAGWEMDRETRPDGFPAGPTIYLCDYEAQTIVLVRLIVGGVEKMHALAQAQGVPYQHAVETLGIVMDQLGRRERALTAKTRQLLSCASAHYLSGTRTYELGNAEAADHFVVIRQFDAVSGARMLRPAASRFPGPMTPEDVSAFVLRILTGDRREFPARFRKNQALRFRATAEMAPQED